jgi:gluconokinase
VATAQTRHPLVVVMGVAGSGKSTVGRLLAERLGVPFAEGDAFHASANIAKLSAGHPLDDTDRVAWLSDVAAWIKHHRQSGGVVSCSALKRRYRDRLRADTPGLFFLHLEGSSELIGERIAARKGHHMPPELLRSQFDALEPLEEDEAGATVSVEGSPSESAERAYTALPPR